MTRALLALDLATVVGYAVRRAEGQMISGVHVVAPPGTAVGPYLDRYARWLVDILATEEPGVVVFEAPILGQRKDKDGHARSTASAATARKLYGLAGLTEMIGHRLDIRVNEVHQGTVLKHFTGHGGGRSAERKARCMDECIRRGFAPEDHNEADALAILHFAEHCLAGAMAA